jgi:predicted transcriptional regulator
MAISIKINDTLKNRVQQIAQARERSAHWIILEAIEQYVDREEKRGSFLREAQESWEEYQRTGRHLTWEETTAWLKTIGTDAQTEFPACHE